MVIKTRAYLLGGLGRRTRIKKKILIFFLGKIFLHKITKQNKRYGLVSEISEVFHEVLSTVLHAFTIKLSKHGRHFFFPLEGLN